MDEADIEQLREIAMDYRAATALADAQQAWERLIVFVKVLAGEAAQRAKEGQQ